MSNQQDYEMLTIGELRSLLAKLGGAPVNKKKAELIDEIVKIESGEIEPIRSRRGRPANRDKDYTKTYDFNGIEFKTAVCDVNAGEYLNSISASGIVDIYPDGYAFLCRNGYSCRSGDVFIERNFVKSHNLRSGDFVIGDAVLDSNYLYRLTSVELVNGKDFVANERLNFDDCLPKYPCEQIKLYSKGEKLPSAIDLFCPIAYGQRSLISLPNDWCDQNTIMDLLSAASKNAKARVICLLTDVNVEDGAAFSERLDVEIVPTYFNQSAYDHVKTAELVFERAKRLVEDGEDVIVAVNSFKRLALAYSALSKNFNGEINREGVEKAKKLFIQGRNLDGGSLTVIGVISNTFTSVSESFLLEELSWCASNVIVLSKELASSFEILVDIVKSNSKNAEKLLSENHFKLSHQVKSCVQKNLNAYEEIYSQPCFDKGFDEFVLSLEKIIKKLK